MKENIKIFIIALIIGMTIAFFVSYKFKEPIAYAINPQITIFYVGTYNNFNEANGKSKSYPDSIIYQNNGIYKIVIGVFNDKEVTNLMKSYFRDKGINFYEEQLKVNNTFLNEIKNYELLIKSSANTYYESLNQSILDSFNEYINKNN